jgi:L-2-hydroxyglutarate oxidase LhgO
LSSSRDDVLVVGAGIVGLSCARELIRRRPGRRVTVLEKEDRVAAHQTGHNSGVIHTGVYYAPGSLKARLCVEGRRLLLAYCQEQRIAHVITGKLITALDRAEGAALRRLHSQGSANGVDGLRLLSSDEIREKEPHAVGHEALWVPGAGIVDYGEVARAFAREITEAGGEIRPGARVLEIASRSGAVLARTEQGDLEARRALVCAGLQSDRLWSGSSDMRILPFRGRYAILQNESARLVRSMIYPVPDPRFPFLGVHFTRHLDGTVSVGPNATLALDREGYDGGSPRWRDVLDTIRWPGFWRLAARHAIAGSREIWRDRVPSAAWHRVRRYLPAARREDLRPGPCGIRAQAVRRDGSFVDDFEFRVSGKILHVLNAPSPAATSALAIAGAVADRAEEVWGDGGVSRR